MLLILITLFKHWETEELEYLLLDTIPCYVSTLIKAPKENLTENHAAHI